MPNPFDLPGPQFLIFYVVLGVFTILILWLARQVSEAADAPRIDYSAPICSPIYAAADRKSSESRRYR